LAEPGSCAGVYASHVLEHLSLEDFDIAIGNTALMLKSGGLFRLIVPDLEARARKYIRLVEDGVAEANSYFLDSSCLGSKQRARSIGSRLREQLGNSRHLWMWDFASMSSKLMDAGFVDIRRCEFNDSEDPMFQQVEDLGRFLDTTYNIRELAMECRK
jgi:hypothetical protein